MSVVLGSLLLLALLADVRACACDVTRPESLSARECSLSRVANEQSNDHDHAQTFFFVHDANPAKPNRWLVLPKAQTRLLSDLRPEERAAYWTTAIQRGRDLWQDNWGIAMNGEEKRTQCQLHLHIGKVADDADRSGGVLVDSPADIPLPPPGTGMWVHAEGSKLRVHAGAQITEFNLVR